MPAWQRSVETPSRFMGLLWGRQASLGRLHGVVEPWRKPISPGTPLEPVSVTTPASDLSKTASEHVQERLQKILEQRSFLCHDHDFRRHSGHKLYVLI